MNTIYNVGDTITFRCGSEVKTGVVFIFDRYGTFEHPGLPSYDIMVDTEDMLYKHVPQNLIVENHQSC